MLWPSLDHRRDDCGIFRVRLQIADEALVDLDVMDGVALQMRQGGEARPEIVESDTNARAGKFLKGSQSSFGATLQKDRSRSPRPQNSGLERPHPIGHPEHIWRGSDWQIRLTRSSSPPDHNQDLESARNRMSLATCTIMRAPIAVAVSGSAKARPKAPGVRTPRSGCCHRASASSPTICPV